MSYSTSHVLKRINQTLSSIVSGLSSNPSKPLTISTSRRTRATRNFMNLSQCRGVTNCILVISFVQKLLMSNRTATNRELYYVFITHFRSQRECDAAIVDVCNMLGVERISLGLTASPKGKHCDPGIVISDLTGSCSCSCSYRFFHVEQPIHHDVYVNMNVNVHACLLCITIPYLTTS